MSSVTELTAVAGSSRVACPQAVAVELAPALGALTPVFTVVRGTPTTRTQSQTRRRHFSLQSKFS